MNINENKYSCLELKKQLCFPIYLCSKEIVRKYTPLLNKLDLTYTQYVVMMYFWEKRTSNVKELGNNLLLDSSTLTPLLKKLEIKGYITRKRNKNDERNLTITLTKKGEQLKDKAIFIPKEIKKCLNLTENEIKDLYILIYKILNTIERDDKNV